MKHFQEILVTLGAKKADLLKSSPDWELWRAEFKTPVSTDVGTWLYLKHRCPLKEGNSANVQVWQSATGPKNYEVIVTPQSDLAKNLPQTNRAFGGREIRTTKQLLLDNFLRDFPAKSLLPIEYFIDPKLTLGDGTSVNGSRYLTQWLKDRGQERPSPAMALLVANGGVGKTTVSRVLCEKIATADSSVIPILIESDQWKHILQTSVTLDALWDLALSTRFESAGRLLSNKTAFQVLIREGLFAIVFDGFDELCLNPFSNYKPKDVINELIQLVTPEDEAARARILLTARGTYWETIKEEIDLEKVEIFRLRAFDNEQRKEYFRNRLQSEQARDLALRFSKEIGGGLYAEIDAEEHNEDRLAGVPFILDLIARYVHDNPDADVNPYKTDPLAEFLQDVCRRESRRQSLELSPSEQMTVFEELFREYPDGFVFDDLKFHLEVLCGVKDPSAVSRFTNHVLLQRLPDNKYGSRYEVLKVYFIARFLAHGLADTEKETERQKVAKILATNSTGNTQLLDWLVNQLRANGDVRVRAAMRHAGEIIRDKENAVYRREASMALFHLADGLLKALKSKDEKTSQLAEFCGAKKLVNGWGFQDLTLAGSVRGFDFSGCEFVRASIIDVEFRNCIFDSNTQFRNSTFESTLAFNNCDGANAIKTEHCSYSKEAEFALDTARNFGVRPEIRIQLAEDSLTRALKKFRGNMGFSSIRYRHRRSGFKAGNPYNDSIWEVLQKYGVITKHEISGVDEGGIAIVNDKDLRRDINAFLDNGVLSAKLRVVLADITK